LEFWVGVAVANPQSYGIGDRKGVRDGTVRLVRKCVGVAVALDSNFSSMFTRFRVSEILPLLCSSTPLFPTPPIVSSKFPHVSLGVGGLPLGYKERRYWAN